MSQIVMGFVVVGSLVTGFGLQAGDQLSASAARPVARQAPLALPFSSEGSQDDSGWQ